VLQRLARPDEIVLAPAATVLLSNTAVSGITKCAPFPISTFVPQIASHSMKLLTHAGAWDYGIADNLCSADILALGGHAVTTYYASFSAKYRSTVCF
jgi:hypothetical protein